MTRLLPLALLACGKSPQPTGDSGTLPTTGQPTEGVFASLIADDLPGVVLSAASHGDELLMVGGEFDGPSGHLVHLQGDRFCVETAVVDAVLWWVHVNGPGDWWAVGEQGVVLRESGGTRTREDVPTQATLFGIYDDGQDVWTVGGHVFTDPRGTGEVWRRPSAGGPWELFDTTEGLAFKVWDGWVVGEALAARIGPTGLEPLSLPGGERLTTVRGRSADDDVWMVGGTTSQEMLQYVDGALVPQEAPALCASRDLMGVWTAPGEDVWISGANGAIARFDGQTWTCPDFPIYFDAFHGVTRHDGQTYFVGGNLLDSSGPYLGAVARTGQADPLPVDLGCP